jgi:hypothetical protein
MSKVNAKPSLKYVDGNIVATMSVGLDMDQDQVNSVTAEIDVKINAMEAVSEVIKDGVPEWLTNLLSKK